MCQGVLARRLCVETIVVADVSAISMSKVGIQVENSGITQTLELMIWSPIDHEVVLLSTE
jgi:hypothetical protein